MAGNDIPLVSETHEGVDLVTPVEERHRVTRFLSTPASLAVIFLLYFVTGESSFARIHSSTAHSSSC